ncbi:MAG: ligand-binding receptor [Planctomycetota bacterium]|nr:MAG: ligand-binding receptor [Planctomycetota bacterium]
MSTALSGPAADLGRQMRAGLLAAFAERNVQGGWQGRELRLTALDDGYEPKLTVPNMRALVADAELLAVVGNVGTPTAVAALPIARRAQIPFIGAFSGAGVLRKQPPEPLVLNYRASYAEETAAMVEALLNFGGCRPEEIAFFTQRDAFGDAGFHGGLAALRAHGLSEGFWVAHGRYERNTEAVENGLADILLAPVTPKAVILVGTYAPCARFIRLARESGLQAHFLNVSFVGANSLSRALGSQGNGVIVTQVVPHYRSQIPAVQAYRSAMKRHQPDQALGFVSLEGYLVGRLLIAGLENHSEAEITRKQLVVALESLGKFDLGLGIPLCLSAKDHQACHEIWPTVLSNGQVEPMDWQDLQDRDFHE